MIPVIHEIWKRVGHIGECGRQKGLTVASATAMTDHFATWVFRFQESSIVGYVFYLSFIYSNTLLNGSDTTVI